jgi:hypothetical protein
MAHRGAASLQRRMDGLIALPPPRGAAAFETLFSSPPAPTLAREHSHFVTGAEAASGGAANENVTLEGTGLSPGGDEVTAAPCGGGEQQPPWWLRPGAAEDPGLPEAAALRASLRASSTASSSSASPVPTCSTPVSGGCPPPPG